MTAQDKRHRAKRNCEIAATKSGVLAHDIVLQAWRLEAAADQQDGSDGCRWKGRAGDGTSTRPSLAPEDIEAGPAKSITRLVSRKRSWAGRPKMKAPDLLGGRKLDFVPAYLWR